MVLLPSLIISGAYCCYEEEYDILGIYILGIVTGIWWRCGTSKPAHRCFLYQHFGNQGYFFSNLLTLRIDNLNYTYFPHNLLTTLAKWGKTSSLSSIGLSAFAIQGAIYAKIWDHPMSAIIVGRCVNRCGGGINSRCSRKEKTISPSIRDFYAVWAMSLLWRGCYWIRQLQNKPLELY